MNTADKLDRLIDEELKASAPIAVLSKKMLALDKFVIKQNAVQMWELSRIKGFAIDAFYLKTCALIALKLHSLSNFQTYEELKILDSEYYNHSSNAQRYWSLLKNAKDCDSQSIFISKLSHSQARAAYAKTQIIEKFKRTFKPAVNTTNRAY